MKLVYLEVSFRDCAGTDVISISAKTKFGFLEMKVELDGCDCAPCVAKFVHEALTSEAKLVEWKHAIITCYSAGVYGRLFHLLSEESEDLVVLPPNAEFYDATFLEVEPDLPPCCMAR